MAKFVFEATITHECHVGNRQVSGMTAMGVQSILMNSIHPIPEGEEGIGEAGVDNGHGQPYYNLMCSETHYMANKERVDAAIKQVLQIIEELCPGGVQHSVRVI